MFGKENIYWYAGPSILQSSEKCRK